MIPAYQVVWIGLFSLLQTQVYKDAERLIKQVLEKVQLKIVIFDNGLMVYSNAILRHSGALS